MVSSFSDITSLKKAEVQLQYAATHDALTGLPLRALLHDRLEHALAHAHKDPGYKIAVLFVDLDGFKAVNDSLGHVAGDDLLKNIAEQLLRCVRATDTVARFGGDEFIVLLEDFERHDDALAMVARILDALTFTLETAGRSISVSASAGVSFADGRRHALDVLKEADTAMYHAKLSGKGQFRVVQPIEEWDRHWGNSACE